MRMEVQAGRKSISYEIDDTETRRSRAALLVRARSKEGLSRKSLAERVKSRGGLIVSERFIERLETGDTRLPDDSRLRALEIALDLDAGVLQVPPVAIARALAELSQLLTLQGSIYGGAYARRFSELNGPTIDFANQLGRGAIELPASESGQWLEDLYRSAHSIRAVAVPDFLGPATRNGHWDRMMDAQAAARRNGLRVQRLYVVEDATDISSWRPIVDKDCAGQKRMILVKDAEAIIERAGRRLIANVPGGIKPAQLDFAIVDDAVVGITLYNNGMGSIYYFGNLPLIREYETLLDSLWEAAQPLRTGQRRDGSVVRSLLPPVASSTGASPVNK